MGLKSTDCLTAGEREALQLYLQTSDPKQIAAHLGKSHHEIERRFKEAPQFDLIKPPVERGWFARNMPFPTKGRPWNALPVGARLIAILAGMFFLVATAVLFVSLAQTLTGIVRHKV